MINKYRMFTFFIACFLGVLLSSTNSFSKPTGPLKLSIEMEADKNNHNSIRISLAASSYAPFQNGAVVLKVPAIGTNPEYETVLWSGDTPAGYDQKFENIAFDLPKGVYKFVAEFRADVYGSYTRKNLYVEVGDSDTVWSTNSPMDLEVEKILIEAKKRGIEVKKGPPIDLKALPDDLKKKFMELHENKNVEVSGSIDKERKKGGDGDEK